MNVKQVFELFVPFVKSIIMLAAIISLIVSGLGVVGVPSLAYYQ
jgi:hypothetical protein